LHRHRIALAALAALSGLTLPIGPVAADIVQSDDHSAYVLLSAGSESRVMRGSTDDMSRASALRVGREGLLYVRQGDAAYVIRDAATLRRAEAIFAPQQALGARQSELGARQAQLGSRQAELGAEQARLAAQLASTPLGRVDAVARQQTELGNRQSALGVQQDALGRQQDALGREQDRLGRQTQESLRALLMEAIQSGAAQRVSRF
jgi:hypothetical protein